MIVAECWLSSWFCSSSVARISPIVASLVLVVVITAAAETQIKALVRRLRGYGIDPKRPSLALAVQSTAKTKITSCTISRLAEVGYRLPSKSHPGRENEGL